MEARVAFIADSGRRIAGPAIDHPGHAEAVDKHTEAVAPEGLLQRHRDLAAFSQGGKDAIGFRDTARSDLDAEAAHGLDPAGRGIGAHQLAIAEFEAGVHDLILPLGRDVAGGGRADMLEHERDLTSQDALISLESFLALA